VESTLLSVTGIDENNKMFRIACAVVERETNESWLGFMTNLKEYLGATDGNG